MTLFRPDRRDTFVRHGVMTKPPRNLAVTADLPSAAQFMEAQNAAPGVNSVTGRPLSVYATLPAGGQAFTRQAEFTGEEDWEYADREVQFGSFSAPSGWVMVVTGFCVQLVDDPFSGGVELLYPARPVLGRLVKNGKPELGTVSVPVGTVNGEDGIRFDLFDGAKPVHVIVYGEDVLRVGIKYQTNADNQNAPAFRATLTGVYLMPNLQAPEYTEQIIGRVEVVNRG